ncbi:MAG: sugar transferase, partial [Bacteroidetes bacterium]|nr:sugar transferase [Bacteroidota bacterium]
EFKIQWLKQESEHKHNKNEEPVAWHFFQKRLVDIIVSSIALILSSPVILVIALAKEIEYIENNVFSNSKNARLMDRIFNWYEFLVLIMFSPIFLLISIPLKIGSKQEYLFSISKNVGVEHRIFDQYKFNTELTHPHPRHANKRSTWLGMLLIKTGLVELPLLINVLKGDISFFGGRSLEIRGVKKTKDQNENQFLTQTNIMGLRHAHQG